MKGRDFTSVLNVIVSTELFFKSSVLSGRTAELMLIVFGKEVYFVALVKPGEMEIF